MSAAAWTPGVSVIMPCHNGRDTLEESVRSLQAQTVGAWRLVIVDDGSTDGSSELIARLASEDQRIQVFTNASASGASAARNRALETARTRHVAFLDCDDVWLPRKLEVQMAAMAEHRAALVCSPYDIMDGEGQRIGHVAGKPGRLKYESVLGYNPIGCLTVLLDRSLCGDVRFDTRLPKSEDYHLWLQVLKSGQPGICVSETLAVYRVHSKSLSANKASAAGCRWRVYRDFEKFNLLKSSYYFALYAATGLWKARALRRGAARTRRQDA
jgi:teichuronic acid biosynthesis glycosyltransferase TuaG